MQEKRIGVELRAMNNLLKRRAEASPVHGDIDALTGTHGYVLEIGRASCRERV